MKLMYSTKFHTYWFEFADSWMKLELDVVGHWMNNSQMQQKLQVECTTCDQGGEQKDVDLRQDQLPFLVISTRSADAVSVI